MEPVREPGSIGRTNTQSIVADLAHSPRWQSHGAAGLICRDEFLHGRQPLAMLAALDRGVGGLGAFGAMAIALNLRELPGPGTFLPR